MNEQAPSPRRWLQFGLKTAVAVMLLCALFSGYTAWWMRRLAQAEERAEAALEQAKQARRQAQVAADRALMAERQAQDQAMVALQEAALSRQQQQESDAKLRALADELEGALAGRPQAPDEGPVVAPPPEDGGAASLPTPGGG